MSLACATGSKKIGPEIVQEALNDLSLDCLVQKSRFLRPLRTKLDVRSRFSLDWLRGKVLKNRVLQTAVLSALLGGIATYLGAHAGKRPVHWPSAATLSSESAAQSKSTLPGTENGRSPNENRLSQPSKFFTYVVQPDDTIWNLCVASLGRYDQAALTELRKLNPELVDPDRIEVGQQIRLPAPHSD
jgi:hypothetical protein